MTHTELNLRERRAIEDMLLCERSQRRSAGIFQRYIARRSITFDCGTKFVIWPHLLAEIGTQTWFCYPSSLSQKGTVENTNRRARR